MYCLVLRSNFALLLTIQFASLLFFFYFFFSATILSGPYLWNRYSQRLQIECTAWSCGLILHCCLPSNSLRCYIFLLFFSATILSGPYLWNRYSQRLQIECAAWSFGLILHCCLPSNLLRYFIIFFFPPQLSGVEFFIFGGSLLGRIQGDREPVSLSYGKGVEYWLIEFFVFDSDSLPYLLSLFCGRGLLFFRLLLIKWTDLRLHKRLWKEM